MFALRFLPVSSKLSKAIMYLMHQQNSSLLHLLAHEMKKRNLQSNSFLSLFVSKARSTFGHFSF